MPNRFNISNVFFSRYYLKMHLMLLLGFLTEMRCRQRPIQGKYKQTQSTIQHLIFLMLKQHPYLCPNSEPLLKTTVCHSLWPCHMFIGNSCKLLKYIASMCQKMPSPNHPSCPLSYVTQWQSTDAKRQSEQDMMRVFLLLLSWLQPPAFKV